MRDIRGRGATAPKYSDSPGQSRPLPSPRSRNMLSPGGYVRQGSHDKRGGAPARAVNVQVAVRCRPLNQRERNSGDRLIVSCDTSRREIQFSPPAGRKVPTGASGGKKTFTYDHVFGPDTTQEDVYKGVVEPIVDEVLQGYNCTVFAYGQTGTGKTHTMEGSRDDSNVQMTEQGMLPDGAGMIPRAVKHVFDHLRSITDEHSVKVSHLELYNEQLTDLLGPEEEVCDLRMYEDAQKGVFVNGLDEIVVKSEQEIFEILDRSATKRRTAETLMNKFSSRSHSVFSITIHIKESTPDGADLLKVGKLNLVDLAGSENVGRSGAVKGRAREAGNINQSLLTLGRVITALVEHHPHIPYRDSKLTRLLQESLGGRNKTCVIATATPGSSSYEETASTLDYAYRAKSIKNRPTVNQMIAKHVLLKDYTDEIAKLKRELDASRSKHGVYLPPDEYERLVAEKSFQGEQLTDLETKLTQKDKNIADLKDMLQKSRTETKRTQQELSGKCATLAATEKELRGKMQELDDERYASLMYRQQATVFRSQGLDLIRDLENSRADNAGLHERVTEHIRIQHENERRISQMKTKIAETERMYRSLVKSFESKENMHIETMQSRVADFVSQAGSRISTISRNFNAFREHAEALQKTHGDEAMKCGSELIETSTNFERSCTKNITSQVKRFETTSEDVGSTCEAINNVLSKLAEDVELLSDNFNNFENKQATKTREFVSDQKGRLDNVSAVVSKTLVSNERRLLAIGSELTKSSAQQMKEMEKMCADAMVTVTQMFETMKVKHGEWTKHAVESANLGFQKSVEESRNGTAHTIKLIEELSSADDEFQTSTRKDRSEIASTVSATSREIMENSGSCIRIVDGHSGRVSEVLSEAKQVELKLKSSIVEHCTDTTDLLQSRAVIRAEEESASFELLSEAEDTFTSRLAGVKSAISEHDGYLSESNKQLKNICMEGRLKAQDLISASIINEVGMFEIDRDLDINLAPKVRTYAHRTSVDAILDYTTLLEENRQVSTGDGPMSSISSSPAETAAKELSNKVNDDKEAIVKPVPEWSSDGRSEEDTLTEKASDDISMHSEPAPERAMPDAPIKHDANVNVPNAQHVTTRKRRAVARSKSSGIRRPRTLSTRKKADKS